MTRIAVTDDWQRIARSSADWAPLMERAEVQFFHEPFGSSRDAVAALSGFDIILAMRERTAFTADVLDQLPNLRFFNMTGRRARGLDEMIRRGIVVSITGGGENGGDTAEHALSLMLAAARQIPEGDRAMRRGDFQEGVPPGLRLEGKTVGILGLGLIGERVAKYCKALGMRVIAWSRSMTPEKARDAGVEAVSREELFASADIISIHLVLSPETTGIVGRRELESMRDGAILVNTSRGPLIDEAALLERLASGKLRAALDVFSEEPLPKEHPLRQAQNTVLTPHVGYGTRETFELFYRYSVENTLAFLDGSPIRLYQPTQHQFR